MTFSLGTWSSSGRLHIAFVITEAVFNTAEAAEASSSRKSGKGNKHQANVARKHDDIFIKYLELSAGRTYADHVQPKKVRPLNRSDVFKSKEFNFAGFPEGQLSICESVCKELGYKLPGGWKAGDPQVRMKWSTGAYLATIVVSDYSDATYFEYEESDETQLYHYDGSDLSVLDEANEGLWSKMDTDEWELLDAGRGRPACAFNSSQSTSQSREGVDDGDEEDDEEGVEEGLGEL